MVDRHPTSTPVEDWPLGWLKMEVASIITKGGVSSTDAFNRAFDMTKEQMIDYIQKDISSRTQS